jgi:beta-mannosidase
MGTAAAIDLPPEKSPPVAAEQMTALEWAPLLRPDVQINYVGSIDKRGGNADWDWWLYQDERTKEWVILDVDGPGCLWNFVVHHAVGASDPVYRFYLDGSDFPTFEIKHSEFGAKPPFAAPLADRFRPDAAADARLRKIDFQIVRSFCPIPFAKSCRVTSSVQLKGKEESGGWGHAIYSTYPTSAGLTTFTGKEDYRRLLELWNRCGKDPKPEAGNETVSFSAKLTSGGAQTLFDRAGAGSIVAIALKGAGLTATDLAQLWIRITWDGEPAPAVECPLGAFFGNECGPQRVATLMQGTDADGRMYCYWPMPFWSSAKVEVVNRAAPGQGPVEIAGSISVKPAAVLAYPRETTGHFRASAYRPPTRMPAGRDSPVATVTGRGHVVAGVITAANSGCEGDVRVHVDGCGTPAVQSDGSESWACYGWGFPYPPQMNPASSYDGTGNARWSMLRLLMGDQYTFRMQLRMTVEGGSGVRGNGTDVRSGLVFWYGEQEPGMTLTDSLDVGNADSEKAHAYSSPDSTPYDLTSSLEGEFDDVPITDGGRIVAKASEFTVRIAPENQGLILRRRSDQARQGQRAAVYVDGVCVKERTWYYADRNPHKRWLEDNFQVPAAYTRGKKEIRVRIEPLSRDGATNWNESFYWVWSLGCAGTPAAPEASGAARGSRPPWLASSSGAEQFPEGRFGKGLAAAGRAAGRDALVTPPLTVECWAKLNSKNAFNILVACDPKASGAHWEIYSYAGTGAFSAYLPGYAPAEVKSAQDIADGKWHYLAMTFDGQSVRLFVDAREVASQKVARQDLARKPGSLCLGSIDGESMGCDGTVDEVRISEGLRQMPAVPEVPFAADKSTLGLWHLDGVDQRGNLPDSSAAGNHLKLAGSRGGSLDELESESYEAGPSPMSPAPVRIEVQEGSASHGPPPPGLSLDGGWTMAENGTEQQRLNGNWADGIPAAVPGSVHGALQATGRIPDPKFGLNDAIAREKSFQTWWFKRTFARPAGTVGEQLVFDGVAIKCTVWLNGRLLGSHEGMFGGPRFDVGGLLADNNTLVVRIDPAPKGPSWFTTGDNGGWKKTVVFNCVWGWHYSNIPALGIWRSVHIESTPAVRLVHPFVATADAGEGLLDLSLELRGAENGWSGTIQGTIEPDNFAGKSCRFSREVKSPGAAQTLRGQIRIPDARLWWPNDLGAQNLYRLKLSFVPDGGGLGDYRELTFGLRTLQMAPLPGGPSRDRYNWTFVVNGRPVFVKGSNWCTMDSSMDFSRRRYDRFLSMAASQHIQLLRAWGGGMPETDDFYDLCDRKGIMVIQEWPTAWNSHNTQPYELLEETVRLNTLRIRNHPALVMWCGGNESDNPFGKAIDMMGRYANELDGTRPFHRGEPRGGSFHNYDCWWGKAHPDRNLNMTAAFFGEFGIASLPVHESVLRYLPDAEKSLWPAPADKSLAHHTPVFNTKEDLARLAQYSGYFTAGKTLSDFIAGSQLAQVVGVRHTLERARVGWPNCTGALYYKLNDNYPAASWSSVDWYGAPKMAHYFFQDSFAPLHGCVLFGSLNSQGKALNLPVFLLDDDDALRDAPWEVAVRAYDGQLKQIKSQSFPGRGAIARVRKLGEFSLTAEQTKATPLLVVSEVSKGGVLADRTYYFMNYEADKGCLFRLPKTLLGLKVEGNRAIVTNQGAVPAVGVSLARPGHLDSFTADAGCFWLDPGESRVVTVSETEGLVLDAWNAGK